MASGGSNYSIPVPGAAGSLAKENPLARFEDDLSRTIVDCEVNADQWTLMHRYNKAADLLEQALNVRPFPPAAYKLALLDSSSRAASGWSVLRLCGAWRLIMHRGGPCHQRPQQLKKDTSAVSGKFMRLNTTLMCLQTTQWHLFVQK